MTIKHLFPASKPALDLNFAAERALDPRITFTRASIGTYVDSRGIIQTAADDEPRFDHDGGTGESLGLLIEESRTNSVTTSGDVKTAAPYTQTGTCSYVTGIAPDGSSSTTLTNWVPDSGATGNALYGIASPGTPAAASVFIKANGWNYAGLWFNNIDGSASGRIFIDLTTGEVLASSNMSSITVVKCANGWWRVGGSSSTNKLGTLSIKCCSSSGSSVTPAMNGTDGILVWGLQTESGTFVTSLIPTSGSAESRAADLCTIEGDNFSSWYQPLENSMFAKVSTFDTGTNSKPALVIFDSTQGSSINSTVEGGRAFYYVGDTNYIQVTTRTPEKVRRVFPNNPEYNPLGQFNSIAQGYAGTDSGCAVNGSDPGYTSSSSLNPGTVDSMWIGRNENTSTWLNGHIARIAYYPTRLPDEQLQALTS